MFNGIAVYLSLMMLFLWAGPKGRIHIARFGMFTDIVVHVAAQLMLGGHGDGRIAVLFGCLMFSFTLMGYRKIHIKQIEAISA